MNMHDDDKDPISRIMLAVIILLLVALVAVQVGIAKGRHLERARINSEQTTK